MDGNSGVVVEKEGKKLTLTVRRGSLFFHVTEPLADDESLEIRCSTMVTAIRGTCGWVEVTDPEHMDVYILEGTVQCSVGDVTESAAAWEKASLSSVEGEDAIGKTVFGRTDIPFFVMDEALMDSDLSNVIRNAPGAEGSAPRGDGSTDVCSASLKGQIVRNLREGAWTCSGDAERTRAYYFDGGLCEDVYENGIGTALEPSGDLVLGLQPWRQGTTAMNW